jgi:predicted dehydrogenase
MFRYADFHKLVRFAFIYGIRRSLVKALGRLRVGSLTRFLINPFKFFRKNKIISVVGCGQFTYATSTFFLVNELGDCIASAYDVDPKALNTYARAYNAKICDDFSSILECPATKVVYIASNHASHTDYAIKCLQNGFDVYIEKPLSVSFQQFYSLKSAISNSRNCVYAGYNRPFSKAILELKSRMVSGPFTLTCSVIGHKIEAGHWYRNPEEGTRVCGNLGHWIDLAIHLLYSDSGLCNNEFNINITYSNPKEPDDNFTVTITTARFDLIVLTLTSREEPYEGICENILFQQNGLIAKIDDFRRAEFQVGSKKLVRKYFYKDVGHKKAALQPFANEKRDFEEVLVSTELMLHIAQMVVNRECCKKVYLKEVL